MFKYCWLYKKKETVNIWDRSYIDFLFLPLSLSLSLFLTHSSHLGPFKHIIQGLLYQYSVGQGY